MGKTAFSHYSISVIDGKSWVFNESENIDQKKLRK